jgi:hypothetical protein
VFGGRSVDDIIKGFAAGGGGDDDDDDDDDDAAAGGDVFVLIGTDADRFGELDISENRKGDAVVRWTFEGEEQSVTLRGVAASELDARDFLFG